MASFIFAVCVALCVTQNAFAQVINVGKGLSSNLGSNYATQVTGNSIVSNNIGVDSYGGPDAKRMASQISNSLSNIGNNIAGNIGSNIASNIGGNFGSNYASNLASNIGSNVASSISNSLASNIGSNLGNSVVSGLSNFGSNVGRTVAGNSVVSNNVGLNLVNNAGTTISNFGNTGASSLAIGGANVGLGNAVTVNRSSNNVVSGLSLGNIAGIQNSRTGEIEIVSDLASRGYTGEYPIVGYVTFEGYIPAEGTVSVASDSCGCVN